MIDKIMKENMFYEPLHNLKESNKSEMSIYDMAFICTLIKKYRPKKILELGVAAGGTTAVIMSCCRMLRIEPSIHSVDVSEYYYRDRKKKSGYIAEDYAQENEYKNFYLYRNSFYLNCSEQIGDGIDMVIIDTVHSLPCLLQWHLPCQFPVSLLPQHFRP